MRKQIVVINGSGGVGKDTFVNFCRDHIEAISISSVDRVKEASRILGWDGGKSEKDRLFLSDMKMLSTAYNDGPFQYVQESIVQFIGEEAKRVIFIHIREPLEIDKIKSKFDCVTVLVRNDNIVPITSNIADNGVNYYQYDYIIDNSGSLDDLKKLAKRFIAEIVD